MRIIPPRWLIPLRFTRALLFAGVSLFLPSLAQAQKPATDSSSRPFFVPRDPSYGRPIPGPPLPHRLTEQLGMLNKLSDEQCLQLYQEILTQPATEESEVALDKIFKAFAQPTRHVPLAQLVSASDRVFIRQKWCGGPLSIDEPWEETKPEETARWLADQGIRFLRDDTVVSDSIGYAIRMWGDKDPHAASEFSVHVPLAANLSSGYDPNTELYWHLRQVTARRSIDDLSGTLAWAEVLPSTDGRRTAALLGVLDQMAKINPSQAADFVRRQLGSNKDAPQFVAQLVSASANGVGSVAHPDEIGGWVLAIPDAAARRAALDSLVDVWLTKVDTLAMHLGALPQVASWADSLPSSEVRAEVLETVAAHWATLRPLAVRNWLHGLPEGPDRNAAVAAYDESSIGEARKKFAGRYPDQGLYWPQMTLFNQNRATELVIAMFFDWARTDPVDASEWAAGHGVRVPAAAMGRR